VNGSIATWLAIAAVAAALLVLWWWHASRPLSDSEIAEVARNRRAREVASVYPFSGLANSESFDIRAFKSGMNASGRFYRVDEPMQRFPAIAGALLKSKKHEWALFAYARDDRVIGVWLNKGPDGSQVWPTLSRSALFRAGSDLRATAILPLEALATNARSMVAG